ncbi:MAG: hypothetical protein M3R70_06335 [Actinomycetota bacterium]|nr:hypothetical protein [Actinomycetota bacterium]
MRKNRFPIALALAALIVAALGSTSVGQAAADAVRAGAGKASKLKYAASPLTADARRPPVRRGPRGPRGLRGLRGSPGPAGPAGAPGTFSAANTVQVNGPTAFMPPGGIGSSWASCPAGSIALSGGWDGLDSPPVDATVGYNKRYGTTTWGVIMVNWASISATYQAFVVCASAGTAAASSRNEAKRAFAQDVARVRAGLE